MTDLQECIGGMEMEKFYLGFDAGTQSVKVTVYNEKMECVASTSAPTTLTYPHPGWVDMDVDEYLALTVNGIAECGRQMREKGLDPKQIQSIMGDGIICGIAGVDEEGNAITPYINYLDSRTQEDEVLINSWELDIWGKETGNPEAKCMFPALFARWLLKNNEAFKARGAKFIHNAPYVLAHLAGLKAKDMFIDWGAMSGWGMGYKVEEKCWSPEQLKLLGIDESMMPKIVKPWDIIGHLTEEMAEMYDGVFVKEMILFFGDAIQYYITEEIDGQMEVTESDQITCSEVYEEAGGGRYERLNEIILLQTTADMEGLADKSVIS